MTFPEKGLHIFEVIFLNNKARVLRGFTIYRKVFLLSQLLNLSFGNEGIDDCFDNGLVLVIHLLYGAEQAEQCVCRLILSLQVGAH
jgi:hypothetical protein